MFVFVTVLEHKHQRYSFVIFLMQIFTTYHEDGVDAFHFVHVGRQRLIAHVPHKTQKTIDRQSAQFGIEPQQTLFYRCCGEFHQIHLFLPSPFGSVRLALVLLVLLFTLQGFYDLQRSADRSIRSLQHFESWQTEQRHIIIIHIRNGLSNVTVRDIHEHGGRANEKF